MPTKTLDSSAFAVGQVIQQLRMLVSDLANLAQTVGGETRATIVQLEGSSAQLMAEMDARFKDRLDQSVDQLEGMERKMLNDAITLINHADAAAKHLAVGAEESAFLTLQEANISSYEALSELPCNIKERVPRLVYANPRKFRIWADDMNPGGDAGTSGGIEIRVRGNFIDSFGAARATINGSPVKFQSSRNDLVLTLPEGQIKILQAITVPTTISLEAVMTGCQGSTINEKLLVTVLPPLKYLVAVQTRPIIEVPVIGRQNFHFEETGNCDSNYRVDRRYPVGPPAKAIGQTITVNSANCGSAVSSHYIEGEYGVMVQAQIKGCGKDCVFGVCNCKGRGWLSYDLAVATEDFGQRELPPYDDKSTAVQMSYVFKYPFSIPVDGKRLKCKYYVRVQVTDGTSVKIAELTNVSGPVNGIVHSANANCDVMLSIPPTIKLRSL